MSKSKRYVWPIVYRIAATGALIAYSAVGTQRIAFAQSADVYEEQGLPPATRRYDIAAGPLAEALVQFEQVSGIRAGLAKKNLGTLRSPGVKGNYSPAEALRIMTDGHPLAFRFPSPDTAIIDLKSQATQVDVVERGTQLSSAKYTEPVVNVPQTITVINRELMDQQAATTLRDVLRNVPGLTVAAGEGGQPAGDNLTLRGFSARGDIFVDGSRDISVQSRDPFNLEQVEVSKGPTSVVAGRGSTGGTINLVSKSPTLSRYFGGNMNLGTDKTRRFGGDLNLPLSKLGLGERTAFRLNMLSHHSDVAGRNAVYNSRWGLAPSLAFGLGTPTRVTLQYSKLKQNNLSDYGIPWVPVTNNALVAYRDKPAPVPRETYYGLKTRDFERNNADAATVRLDHDFSDSMVLRNQFRFGRTTRDSNATPPRFASNDSTAINRELRAWIAKDKIFDNQTDFRANFGTGFIRHAMVAGATFSNENNVRNTRTGAVTPTSFLNPNPDDVYTLPVTLGATTGDITGNTQAGYLFDTVKFGDHLEATGGLRWERFAVRGLTTANVLTARTDKMTSGRAGLVYKPVQAGSVYAAYSTSQNPSLEGLSYSTANTSIPPEKTYNLEAGSKWEALNNRLLLAGAVFRTDKTNARTPGILPDDPPQVLSGKQRVTGLELSVNGNVTRNLKVFGAYTLLNSKIATSNTPAEVGKYFQNTPRNSASTWVTYQHKRVLVGGGPRYVGKRYGNNINTRSVESYWTIDGLASYNINKNVDLRFNISNANDAFYFDRLGGGHLIPGPARVANFSLYFKF